MLRDYFEKAWYRRFSLLYVLFPFSILYRAVISLRRKFHTLFKSNAPQFDVPVIVVGNITVGGTGKTPLIIALAKALQEAGLRPGIVSRGYGAKSEHYPRVVTSACHAHEVGDEPLLLLFRTQCPVVIDPNRVRAVKTLLMNYSCDVVLSDDGLQHHGLYRDIEIAVMDGQRRLGNRWCLPVGPLREPKERLKSVDFICTNGNAQEGEVDMRVLPQDLYQLKQKNNFKRITSFTGQEVHAIAGIGNPARFFDLLKADGIKIIPHVFPDHYSFAASDISFNDDLPVILTEKDAVKCQHFANENHWVLPIELELPDAFLSELKARLEKLKKTNE